MEAIPVAKARGIMQPAMSRPERISGVTIVSEITAAFARVIFVPAIVATIHNLADDIKGYITQLRIITGDAAITSGLWLWSKYGTWQFFLSMPDTQPGSTAGKIGSCRDRQLGEGLKIFFINFFRILRSANF